MDKAELMQLYEVEKLSANDIALRKQCSVHKVNYWLEQHNIQKRTISDALYVKLNGDNKKYTILTTRSREQERLYGVGVGIFWGEGNKRCPNAIRVGNSDPVLIKTFMRFLVEICGVSFQALRFSLQLFTDIDEYEALAFWQKQLKITRKQIMPTVNRIKSGKIGTYKVKNQYGVMTVYFFDKKLRDWMIDQLYMPR